jgi:hypothetical protein
LLFCLQICDNPQTRALQGSAYNSGGFERGTFACQGSPD